MKTKRYLRIFENKNLAGIGIKIEDTGRLEISSIFQKLFLQVQPLNF